MKRYAIALLAVAALAVGCGTGGTGSTNTGSDSKGNPVAEPAKHDPAKADPNDFCANFKVYIFAGMTVGLAAFGGMADDPDVKKATATMQESIDNLAKHAPGEIRGDFEMARDYTEKWVAELKKGNTDPPEESPEYKAASDRIVKFGQKKCGDLIPGLPSPKAS